MVENPAPLRVALRRFMLLAVFIVSASPTVRYTTNMEINVVTRRSLVLLKTGRGPRARSFLSGRLRSDWWKVRKYLDDP